MALHPLFSHPNGFRTFGAAAEYASPYSTSGLIQYVDVNFGPSGVVLNDAGNVVSWKNKAPQGSDFTNSTGPPTYTTVDGFPCIDFTGTGGFGAMLNQRRYTPFTMISLVKLIHFPAALEYEVLQGAAFENSTSVMYIKNSDRILMFTNGGYTDLQTPYPHNAWTVVATVWDNNGSFAVVNGAYETAGPMNYASYTSFSIGGGGYLQRLFMAYDYALTVAQIANLTAQIKQEYGF